MSKYATCPWSAQADNKTIVSADGVVVALVHINRTRQNADLIAAAPDMLEALRITRGNVASLGPAGAIEPFAPYREWLQMLDEVIAKATGAQQ